jgi:maleylacetate reductase
VPKPIQSPQSRHESSKRDGLLKCLPQDMVRWGQGIVPQALQELPRHGVERPIVFTIERLFASTNQLVLPHLEEVSGVFTDLPPHAPDTAIEAALARCIRTGTRSIIAYGDGSVLDAAKAVSHFHYIRQGSHLPIVALPTTLSGSEFSHYFGVTVTSGARPFKKSRAERATVPRVVLLDPNLLLNTPRSLLLSSAIKGMDHAIEGMREVDIDHPHAIMAASGARRFFDVLAKWPDGLETDTAIEEGKVSLEDLLQLQLAAWQCYFYPASVIYGLSHRIGHVLGGTFGFPHSMTSCITLAPVIRSCASRYGEKLRVFDAQGELVLADRIEALVSNLALPTRLRSFEIGLSTLPEIAALLRENYPNEVEDLGEGADRKLDDLLRSLW